MSVLRFDQRLGGEASSMHALLLPVGRQMTRTRSFIGTQVCCVWKRGLGDVGMYGIWGSGGRGGWGFVGNDAGLNMDSYRRALVHSVTKAVAHYTRTEHTLTQHTTHM